MKIARKRRETRHSNTQAVHEPRESGHTAIRDRGAALIKDGRRNEEPVEKN